MVTRTQHPKVYFSNQLEELAHFLGKNLFAEGTVPFSSPKVIVPSHSMKVWMKNFFASKFGICISIEFQTALEALPPHFMPSSRELFFKIHQRLLDNPPPEFVISKKTTLFVSDTLSKLFYSYNWEGVVPTQLWQKDLWDHIFEKNTLSQTLQQESGSFAHLFGFVHLPKDYYDFFAKGGSHFYFMTPSAFFSEDLCSDRERIFLEKKMEGKQVKLKVRDQLIDLIKDVHPLLANFGKAGKALIQKFADTQSFLEENYVEAEGATTLQFLQRSLLHFETSEIIQGSDSSIQVLAASSKLREVEVLFDAIYQKRLENSSLQPKDFLVVCPDLESYFPYIQMVFKGSFSIHGICIDQRAQALSHFFGLGMLKWTQDDLLSFIRFPSVMKKFQFSSKDISIIESWIEKSPILWGWDASHRKMRFEMTRPQGSFGYEPSSHRSWNEAISLWIKALAIESQEEIPWTEVELLGKWIEFLIKLQKDLSSIYQGDEKTPSTWSSLTASWINQYFEVSSYEEQICSCLENLSLTLQETCLTPIPYEVFKTALDELTTRQKGSIQPTNLNVIKFLPLNLGETTPSEVICVLGANEDLLPRKDPPCALSEHFPQILSKEEKDRYLFLELILHARNSLIFTYQNTCWKDQKELGPSRLVTELLTYINGYRETPLTVKQSPILHFENSSTPFTFIAERSYFSNKRLHLPPFYSNPTISDSTQEKQFVHLSDLRLFSKDPLRCFFKLSCGFDFPFKESDSELKFNFLESFLLKKNALISEKSIIHAPLGILGEIAIEKTDKEIAHFKQTLNEFGITEIFSIELSRDVRTALHLSQKRVYPAILIDHFCIEGSLGIGSNQGLLWFEKKQLKQIVPLLALISFLTEIEPSCILLETGKKIASPVENPNLFLSKYLSLYSSARQAPYVLEPSRYEDFLRQRDSLPQETEWIRLYEQLWSTLSI